MAKENKNINLKVILNVDGSISSTWSHIPEGVRYQLHIHTPGNTFAWANKTDIKETSFTTKAGLPDGKWYWIQLLVYTGPTNIEYTYYQLEKLFLPAYFYDNYPLTAPTNVTATASTVRIDVKWDAVLHARSYDLLLGGTVYNQKGTSKAITNLQPNTNYTYCVRAKSPNVTGPYSPVKTIKTQPFSPAIPSGIKKTVTETSATISWGAANLATSYDIIFNGTTYNVNGTSRSFTGLTPCTGYTFQIRAKNADAASAYTTQRTVTTAPKPPAVTGAVSTSDTVTVTWGAVNGATGYMVKFDGQDYLVLVPETKFIYKGLKPNTSHTYQVSSKSADGTGSYSGEKSIRTLPQPPSIPTGIQKSATDTSATISWGAVSGATSYDVLFDGKTYNVTGTSKTVTGLSPNNTYQYSVCAKNANGSGAYSSTYSVTTAPGSPAEAGASTDEGSATVTWNAVPGATGYDITFNGATYAVSGTSKKFTGLSPNTVYKYQIRAKNADGSGSYGTAKTVRTTPLPPQKRYASATQNSADLSWDRVEGANGYDVLFNGKTYHVTEPSKTVAGLSPGSTYSWQVRSNNEDGSSAYGPTQNVTTLPNPPSVPANANAVSTADTATVTWNATSGATGYEVQFNGSVYSATGTSKTFTGLKPNTKYNYAVRAINSGGASAYSAAKTIQTASVPPVVPANVSATATVNSVTVSFSASSNATGYDILFNGSAYSTIDTSKTFTGLTPQTNYSYAVRAKNVAGTSAYSVAKTIATLQSPPSVPLNVSASATANSVTISWSAAAGAASYDVLFNGTEYNVTGSTNTFSGLLSGTKFTYQVRAKNAGGTSAYSSVQTIRTLLGIPTNIKASATEDSVSISWDPVSGAAGYDVRFEGAAYHVEDTGFEKKGLASDTEYTFSVRGMNAECYGEYSKDGKVRTLVKLPEPPSYVHGDSTLNSVRIEWSPVEGAQGYDVEFDGKNYHVAAAGARTARTMSLEIMPERKAALGGSKIFYKLRPNTRHGFRVRTVNKRGAGNYSSQQSILTKISKKNGLPGGKRNKRYADGKIPYMGLDPVNAMTGAFLWSYTFLEEFGKDMLHFTAMYDSQREESHQVMGRKWTYSLDYLLYMDSEYAYFSTPYDEVVPFRIDTEQGLFHPVEGVEASYTMERKDNGFYLVRDLDGTEYIFDECMCLTQIMEDGLVSYRFRADSDGRIIRIEGRCGSYLTVEYAGGRISKVTDGAGCQVTFTYTDGLLTAAKNAGGKGISFTCDENDNLLMITDFADKVYLTNRYDDRSRVVEQSMAGRGTTRVSYDEEHRKTTFIDEVGSATIYSYDEGLHVTAVELGKSGIRNQYDEKGQLTKQTDSLGNSTVIEYDQRGRICHTTYADGTEEYAYYNDSNSPVRVINRDGSESQYTYDEADNLISSRDERGNTSHYTYDNNGNMLTCTDKNGALWAYSYDAANHIKQAVDPEGNSYYYSHDAIGRLLSYTSPTGLTTTYNYSENGDLLQIKDATGTVIFDYDDNGNQTGITDKMGNKQSLLYNEMGQLTLATDFLGNKYTFEYDKRGNLVKEIDPRGYNQKYGYDGMGNKTDWADKNGGKTKYSFDVAGQLTEVLDAAGGLIKYTYDTMGQIAAVTDPLRHQTSYTYDAMGRLTSETNALGLRVAYTYDPAGNLLSKTDESGAVISYSYDKENRLETILSDAGLTQFTYDLLGRIIAIRDTEGNQEATHYDGNGNVIEATDKEGSKTTYTYDESGRLTQETDSKGAKTTYEYDRNGNCIKYTDACGNEYLYEYDANNCNTSMTDPLGNVTRFEYDTVGNLTSTIDPKGRKTLLLYDGVGNLVREYNLLDGMRSYYYDALNRLTKVEDEDGHISAYTYDAGGNMTSYTDGNGNRWNYEYDAGNRLISVKDEEKGVLKIQYTKTGQIEKVTDQEGAKTQYAYDSMKRLIKMSDALNNSISWTYDSLGKIRTKTDANGYTTEYQYSPSGNLIRIKEPEGNETTFTYDAAGRIMSQTDALGSTTTYERDVLGQIISITDAMGGKTLFSYTARGEIASVTDANGGVTQYQYDACGNLIQTTDPLNNIVEYEYDAMNNQISECIPTPEGKAHITIYQYNKKCQVVREINPVLDEKVYTYDANGNILTVLDEESQETRVRYDLNNRPVGMDYSDGKKAAFRYNKRGELVELKDWNGTTAMVYDITGRLQKVRDHNGRLTGYTYDGNGNTIGITYPDGSTVSCAYDKNNRLSGVTDAEGKLTEYTYNPAGNLLCVKQPGSTTTYAYNEKGEPVREKYQLKNGDFQENAFTYDAVGNILSMVKTGSSPILTDTRTFSYDAIGQLLAFTEGKQTRSFGYDALGNRTFQKVNGSQEAVYEYNELNQLAAKIENGIPYRYGYDKCGNLREEHRGDSLIRQYLYDATGHMTVGTNQESKEKTEYTYNALYMRVKNIQTLENKPDGYISSTGQTGALTKEPYRTKEISYVTDFLSGTNNELMSYEKGFGATRVTYGRGYERLSQRVLPQADTQASPRSTIAQTTIGKAYFQSDMLGSVLFASDEQGKTLRCAQRGSFGGLKIPVQEDLNSAGIENSLLFTTYRHDPVIGKYFAQARFYDEENGRMLSADPVRRGPNGYPYCKNNPVNYTDPTGEVVNVLAGVVFGGLTGGVFGFAGSAISQYMNHETFSMKKALGSAANGSIVGAVRGGLLSTGAGFALSLVSNFAAGAAGSAAEQQIGRGHVSIGESVAGGLSNAVSGAIYGNSPLRNVKDAFWRGAKAGAFQGAMNNLMHVWDPVENGNQSSRYEQGSGRGRSRTSPYTRYRDPRSGCGSPNPFRGKLSYGRAYGYQYQRSGVGASRTTGRRNGFRLGSFLKDTLMGGLMGGMGSAAFYGSVRAFDGVRNSIRNSAGTQRRQYAGGEGSSNAVNRPSARTQINTLPETKAPNAIKASEVTNAWDDYLGSNTTNAHPITGQPDPNRIFTSDATRSIRLGNHEMKSFGTTKAHFHYEKWDYNAADDVMNISNIMQRFRE